MINNSFLLPVQGAYIKDGQAIVATTEDEGLWFSFDYGETWLQVENGSVVFEQSVITAAFNQAGFGLIQDYSPSVVAIAGNTLYQFILSASEWRDQDLGRKVLFLRQDEALGSWAATHAASPGAGQEIYRNGELQYTVAGYSTPRVLDFNIRPFITKRLEIYSIAYRPNGETGVRLNGAEVEFPDWDQPYDQPLAGSASPLAVVTNTKFHIESTSTGWESYDAPVDIGAQLDAAGRYTGVFAFSFNLERMMLLGYDGATLKLFATAWNGTGAPVWVQLFTGDDIRSVAISGTGQVQAVAIYQGGLELSTDGGATWTTKLAGKKLVHVHCYRNNELINRAYRVKQPKL